MHAGGFTADFGDRMSAVIDATSVPPDADQQYQLGLSLFNASLFAFNRFDDGRGQWLVAARRSNLDEIADLVDASYGELRYSDAFARLDYEFTPDTRGSLHVLAVERPRGRHQRARHRIRRSHLPQQLCLGHAGARLLAAR